jgi:ABC-type branched-subunit amino acid transport system ATPase component
VHPPDSTPDRGGTAWIDESIDRWWRGERAHDAVTVVERGRRVAASQAVDGELAIGMGEEPSEADLLFA